eukprot:TRINITY_DN3387_c0_g2_i1.p1 TRINITY_DN3387_c0_g2~~TRINITY_DN3387_c0_g2_i1.p1  ORF type:complete len:425 (-),score=72.91 TRINITY_DN3387_c0_g2_i1:172-1446(-)
METNEEEIQLEDLIIDKESISELTCRICFEILKTPRQCKNGHLFCITCIENVMNINTDNIGKCPCCRVMINSDNVARNMFVEKAILKLKIYCPYKFKAEEIDDNGCKEEILFCDLDKHKENCMYKFVECPFNSECERLRLKDVPDHKLICKHRIVECKYCEKSFKFFEIENHSILCTHYPISCNCGINVQRYQMQLHLKDECQESIVPCQFEKEGCSQLFKRSDVFSHLQQNVTTHLNFLRSHFDKELTNVVHNFESLVLQKDNKIKSLEKKISSLTEDTKKKYKISWKIDNWEKRLKSKEFIQSKKFKISGLQFFLGMYTDGDNVDSKGFVSVYLFCDEQYNSTGKFVSLTWKVTFENKLCEHMSIVKEFQQKFPLNLKNGSGWGNRKSLKSTEINKLNGYIDNNGCLFIKCNFCVDDIEWVV